MQKIKKLLALKAISSSFWGVYLIIVTRKIDVHFVEGAYMTLLAYKRVGLVVHQARKTQDERIGRFFAVR